VLRFSYRYPFTATKVLTTTNNNYHGKFKKDEFTPILSDIIRMMVMTRLGLAKEENRPILAMNILTKNKGISTEDRLSLLIAMPVILDKINRTLSDESIQDLKDAIEESGESAKDFINEMMVEEIDGKEFVALAHKNRIEN
jgi:hypothetical protein